jgi:hypothetical protein
MNILHNLRYTINFNRIYGNVGYGLENQGNLIINATNNWWGSNADPSQSSSDITIMGEQSPLIRG